MRASQESPHMFINVAFSLPVLYVNTSTYVSLVYNEHNKPKECVCILPCNKLSPKDGIPCGWCEGDLDIHFPRMLLASVPMDDLLGPGFIYTALTYEQFIYVLTPSFEFILLLFITLHTLNVNLVTSLTTTKLETILGRWATNYTRHVFHCWNAYQHF